MTSLTSIHAQKIQHCATGISELQKIYSIIEWTHRSTQEILFGCERQLLPVDTGNILLSKIEQLNKIPLSFYREPCRWIFIYSKSSRCAFPILKAGYCFYNLVWAHERERCGHPLRSLFVVKNWAGDFRLLHHVDTRDDDSWRSSCTGQRGACRLQTRFYSTTSCTDSATLGRRALTYCTVVWPTSIECTWVGSHMLQETPSWNPSFHTLSFRIQQPVCSFSTKLQDFSRKM